MGCLFRGTSSHSPEMNQLEDVTTTKTGPATASLLACARVDDDIQNAIRMMFPDGEDQEQQWRSMYSSLEPGNMSHMNLIEPSTSGNHSANSSLDAHVVGCEPQTGAQGSTTSMGVQSSQGPFKSWRHTRILAPILQKNDRTNQELLRRCIDMMKQIPNLQQGASNQNETAAQAVVQTQQAAPRVTASSSSPETAPDCIDIGMHDLFDQVLYHIISFMTVQPRFVSDVTFCFNFIKNFEILSGAS